MPLAGLLAALLFPFVILMLLGCCPIPFPVRNVVVPETEVTVFDAEDGDPIPDAEVRIERYVSHVHGEDLADFKVVHTDENGQVFVEEMKKTETIMPLVPHGPDYYTWYVCVEHDDYQTRLRQNGLRDSHMEADDDGEIEFEPPWEVTVELEPGESTPCDEDYEEFEQDIEPL